MHKQHARSAAGVSSIVRNSLGKRRSNRMSLNATVDLTGEDRQKTAFKTNAKATNLNKHGGVVQLSRDLPVGSSITLRNRRGVQVAARIVSQISAVEGLRTYGVEFVELDEHAQHFWGISFPSA